jgi:hypothetical protein
VTEPMAQNTQDSEADSGGTRVEMVMGPAHL